MSDQPTPQPAGSHTITIPLDPIANAALAPLTLARRVLPAKGGLPVYAGIGALAALSVIEWPVAAAAGAGYAALRYWGPLRPAPEVPEANPET